MTARTLPGTAGVAGVHHLRTLDDAAGLRAELGPGTRLVVVGDGVLGAETAATARGLGAEVTLVGPAPFPMAAQLGGFVGERLAALHTGHGVRVLAGRGVAGIEHDGDRVTGVRLDHGTRPDDTRPDEGLLDDGLLDADVVVVAVGSGPATGWLAGSGLDLDGGVVTDSRGRAEEGIWAVGDVCRFLDERTGAHVRLENRTHAGEQTAAVAANLLGADRPYLPVPYFWTDQYAVKVQVYGSVPPGARTEVCDGDPDTGLARAREQAPVSRVQLRNGDTPWLVTRYADQRALMLDPRISSDATHPGYPHESEPAGTAGANPDTLDLTRDASRHVAFGYGVHQCLGQGLARMELQVVYSTLYRRIPTLAAAVPLTEIPFKHDGSVYGVHSLPVTW